MKHPDVNLVTELEELPNIGKAMAADLRLIGINHPAQLKEKDPFTMYEDLCAITGMRHDPCVIDVFLAVVDFMDNGISRPWWSYTAQRKKYTG